MTIRDKNPDIGVASIEVEYPQPYSFIDFDAEKELREENPIDDNFIKAINEFSYKTSTNILTDTGENINYSPLSLYFALSLAASGAEGETEEQLLALLGVSDKEFLSEQCGNFYRMYYKDNEIGKLKIANSIWMDHEYKGKLVIFKDEFVKNAAKNFMQAHAVLTLLILKPERLCLLDFNKHKWYIDSYGRNRSEQILSIISTVYFDQWIDRFDSNNTKEDVFYLSNGDEVKVDFMNQTYSSAGFTKGEGFTRASLWLKNRGHMVFILPDEGVSPYDLISSPEDMKRVFEGGEGSVGEVVWKIPKFSFESKLTLNKMLESLGVSSAFKQNANFSGITKHMCYITDILQETHIGIDEDGVEASAYTQLNYMGRHTQKGGRI